MRAAIGARAAPRARAYVAQRGGFDDSLLTAACDTREGGFEKCLFAYCCPLCASSSIVGSLPFDARFRDGGAVPCAGSCGGVALLLCIPVYGQFAFLYTRARARCWIRERSGGAPADLEDVATVWCCLCCANVQEAVQLQVIRGRDGRVGAGCSPALQLTAPPPVIVMR